MGLKVIITGAKPIDKFAIARKLVEINDNLSIAPTFTSDKDYEGVVSDTMYYMSTEDVILAFKNNVILYINTDVYISHGITIDNFYNNDIFVMNLDDFNSISDHNIAGQDMLVIWVDTKHYDDVLEKNKDITESKYLAERLETIPYMYFLDTDAESIAEVINNYVEADNEEKLAIIEENN